MGYGYEARIVHKRSRLPSLILFLRNRYR